MEHGIGVVREIPLVRKVRTELRKAFAGREEGFSLRRDVGGLVDRLERLRECFPDAHDLLDRVGLSPHVLGVLAGGEEPSPVGEGIRG